MCIWYKCSILLMIFIFWSIHGYYIRKEKNLCFSGVCQPNQKLFIDYLPVWGNSNLIFSQCPWCILSYGCWLLWALCVLLYIVDLCLWSLICHPFLLTREKMWRLFSDDVVSNSCSSNKAMFDNLECFYFFVFCMHSIQFCELFLM